VIASTAPSATATSAIFYPLVCLLDHMPCVLCVSRWNDIALYWLYYQRHTDLFADVQDDLPRRRFSTL